MSAAPQLMSLAQFGRLLAKLGEQRELFGPVLRDQTIAYDRIVSVDDLPRGYEDEQSPGYYRLHANPEERFFAYTTSPDSWKKFLFPKEEVLYSASKNDDGQLLFKTQSHKPQAKAFIGVRACDLTSVAIQDRVFLESDFVDGAYAARRADVFIVAVNCSRSVETCFCTSMGCGPKVKSGFDLALTEVVEKGEHYFVVDIGSEEGASVIAHLGLDGAQKEHLDAAEREVARAAQQSRRMDTDNLKEDVYAQLANSEFWKDLGERCLHCANCTLVCPTCFCSNVEDATDLSGQEHQRVRYWDSCFNQAHSHIAGGSVHESPDARYRQWFTHKLASWQDQFDTIGCSGCGRCITWCPVGIDITEEVRRLQSLNPGE